MVKSNFETIAKLWMYPYRKNECAHDFWNQNGYKTMTIAFNIIPVLVFHPDPKDDGNLGTIVDGGAKNRRPPKKAAKKKSSSKPAVATGKVHTGPRGGKFVLRNGHKVYV
jgi:hypothetical protein